MKTLMRTAIVLGVLVFGGKLAIEKITTATRLEGATKRVSLALAGLAPGAESDIYQTAICMWWAGSLSLDQDQFNMAASLYDRWARSLGKLDAFEISSSELEQDGDGILVGVTTPKGPLAFRVLQGKPLESVE
jgi:hypothetical protein